MTCPHPEKRRYATKAEAVEVIAAMYATGAGNPDLNAYRCSTGPEHWHVGHSVVRFRKRIRRALKPHPPRRRA